MRFDIRKENGSWKVEVDETSSTHVFESADEVKDFVVFMLNDEKIKASVNPLYRA